LASPISLGLEMAKHGINVNCVAPGLMYTEMLAEAIDANPETVQQSGATGPNWADEGDRRRGGILVLGSGQLYDGGDSGCERRAGDALML
jgi:NAD(P)-dependent dehydrogenase (short-subunit alcohol dehydrogenase family)